jgi:S1-C subfamily serine protease
MNRSLPGQHRRFLNRVTLGFLFILAGTFFLLPYLLEAEWGKPLGPNYSGPEVLPRAMTPSREGLSADEKKTIDVFNQASQSVVFIENTAIHRDPWSFNLFEVPQGNGSGFIWNTSGHIITNFHVIYGANEIRVILADQTQFPAKVVGVDPDHDIAVLQIRAPSEKMVPLRLGASKGLQVGQKVLAIGNPFGLDHTLTTGIVSALGRTIKSMTGRTIREVIQTDAAINPGNSGGPLLDSFGRLIGINTQIISPSGVFSGIGFAVPVDIVNRIVPQLIQYGKVIRPSLGIRFLPEQIARSWGIKGLVIGRLTPGGPADQAGLRGTHVRPGGNIHVGDILLTIDGKPVQTTNDLLDVLDRHQAGDEVKVEYARGGQRRQTTISLQILEPLS